MTLGIFWKLFNVFDRECRRLDYLLQINRDEADEELEKVLDELFFTEDKICNFQESLAQCTEGFLMQLEEIDEDNDNGRTILMDRYKSHVEKVEGLIKKLVSFFPTKISLPGTLVFFISILFTEVFLEYLHIKLT